MGRFSRLLRRRSLASHDRRRRAAAALAVAVIALLAVPSLESRPGSRLERSLRTPLVIAEVGRVATLLGAAPMTFISQEAAGENAAITRTLAYTPYVRIAGGQHREIALTFDDGPGPYTPAILATLERDHVPATFFEVGVLERYFHASTSEILTDGYVIGDHTQLHAPMSHLSAAQQRVELLEQAATVAHYGVPFPRLFRPPYGMFDAATLALLRRYHMLMVMWTVDTNDYRRPGVRAIVRAAVSGARPGAIILMHDAGGNRSQTVAALPLIIAALRKRGYELVTVPRLLLDNPPPRGQSIRALAPGVG